MLVYSKIKLKVMIKEPLVGDCSESEMHQKIFTYTNSMKYILPTFQTNCHLESISN
jgi:hypothetical protein